ncbi:hypothetical protein NLI96_g6241 [Meripilus lineatus]|uniref:Uncharacterized protein n=1 Tax=Meripilus lineatus TaxID=2056292 RepID=A0AAD5V6L5_9APHY|nr:hypothetical protein NLI96_g6241 [Physisporinus lineatus]
MPDDFKIWLLEWPAKAVVGWIWPGLRGRPSSEPTDIAIDTRGMNVLGYSAAPYLNKFTLFDPDVERDGLDSAMTHPRSWTSKIWHELEVDSVVVSTIFICWKDPCFASRDWLQYVTAVSKGGEPLLGNVRHFALGDGGCIAKSWAEFLEHELEFEEWDYGGGRFDIAGLFGENE